MTIVSKLELVQRIPLFAGLNRTQAESVALAVTKRRFKRGDILVQQGQKSNALGILLAGRVITSISDKRGREVILATLRPGDYLGEIGLIDNGPHSATACAEVQTDVLLLERAEFERLLTESASMTRALMEALVRRVRSANQKIESLALMNVGARVARVLIDAAELDDRGEWIVRYKMSRRNIGKMVGASREMVSRIVKEMEESGSIQKRGQGSMCITELLRQPL